MGEYSTVRRIDMPVDAQKNLLYAEITRRAGLYTKMLTLQRNNAPAEEIDHAIAAIGTAEAEIRRMSDEINDRIWYANYGKALDLLGQEVEGHGRTLTLLEEHGALLGKLGTDIDAVSDRVDTLEERADQSEQHNQARDERLTNVEMRIDKVETRLETVEATLEALASESGAMKASVEMLRNIADEPPAAIKKRMP